MKPEIKLIFAFAFGILLMWFLLPPSQNGNIQTYKDNELRYQETFKKKEHQISVLKGRSETLELTLSKAAKVNDSLSQLKSRIRVVYLEAREATDQNPDSLNLLNEVISGRELIDRQEDHINALLDYSAKQDSLLGVRLEIIQKQDTLLSDWQSRFDNIVAQKDEEIKQVRKRGNIKLGRGLIIGAIAGLLLGVI